MTVTNPSLSMQYAAPCVDYCPVRRTLRAAAERRWPPASVIRSKITLLLSRGRTSNTGHLYQRWCVARLVTRITEIFQPLLAYNESSPSHTITHVKISISKIHANNEMFKASPRRTVSKPTNYSKLQQDSGVEPRNPRRQAMLEIESGICRSIAFAGAAKSGAVGVVCRVSTGTRVTVSIALKVLFPVISYFTGTSH